MTDDGHPTRCATRADSFNGAFKTVKFMLLAANRNGEGLIVLVMADFADVGFHVIRFLSIAGDFAKDMPVVGCDFAAFLQRQSLPFRQE